MLRETPAIGQMRLDGTETSSLAPSSAAAFSAAQRAILRMIANGPIRSRDAGRIVHLHRLPPCSRCACDGSCRYASSDGCVALKRLQARGCVRRIAHGLWEMSDA